MHYTKSCGAFSLAPSEGERAGVRGSSVWSIPQPCQYVTAQPEPNDVDVILVMKDSFHLEECPTESRGLFDHPVAQARYGASIFWIRPGMLIEETVEEFVQYWQIKRGGAKRGIVDVTI